MAEADPLDWLTEAESGEIEAFMAGLNRTERREWRWDWSIQARPSQLAPAGDWRVWLVMAGRGFGKTRAGAEWVRAIAQNDGSARIALVGASLVEARSVMVEGESGLLACCRPGVRPLRCGG